MIDNNIGFIGLGNVGSKLANTILQAKYKLYIHDIDKNTSFKLVKNGAIWKNNLKDLLENTSIIITCLPSPQSVVQVVEQKNGIAKYINNKHLWIEMSTTDQKEMIRLSKIIESKGASVLEAPITGGQHKAESGNISVTDYINKLKHYNSVTKNITNNGNLDLEECHLKLKGKILCNEKLILRESMWDPVIRVYYFYDENNRFDILEKIING